MSLRAAVPKCRAWLVAVSLRLLACGHSEPEPTLAPDDPAGSLFDPNHVVEVEIRMAEDDWDVLRHQSRTWVDNAANASGN
jgi:hypothetical protein